MTSLRNFVRALADLLGRQPAEPEILYSGGALLADLVSHDDWLPDEYARPSKRAYQQFLLHGDSRERFSIVSFVWGPGQGTPIHDHTVWGLIGMLRGSEVSQRFRQETDGRWVHDGRPQRLEPGQVVAVSPAVGDVHQVRNAQDDRVSISIHVYGANIGRIERSIYTPHGRRTAFVSGYVNETLPNIWNAAKDAGSS